MADLGNINAELNLILSNDWKTLSPFLESKKYLTRIDSRIFLFDEEGYTGMLETAKERLQGHEYDRFLRLVILNTVYLAESNNDNNYHRQIRLFLKESGINLDSPVRVLCEDHSITIKPLNDDA